MRLDSASDYADPEIASAGAMLDAYRRGAISPVEVTQACLDRIKRFDPQVNAFSGTDPEGALAMARESERRWRAGGAEIRILEGVPVTIKDLLMVKGWPMRRGSLTTDDQPQQEDAPAVARLREAGAVLIGRTTTPEFGWKGITDSPLTGITRNPWHTGRTPGGSSGGAAVAAALAMGALHIGTDGGGSIRIPAAFTGIFGFKPNYGRVPAWPSSPFGDVAHIGPMTRTVSDAALMLNAIARWDDRDWRALPPDQRDWRIGLGDGVSGLRIGWSPTLGGLAAPNPEIAAITEQACRSFASELGAIVEPADPELENPSGIFRDLWFAGAASLMGKLSEAQREKVDPGLLAVAEMGAKQHSIQLIEAGLTRARVALAMRRFHRQYDLLVTPMLPLAAFDAGVDYPRDTNDEVWIDWSPYSYPFNLTQQPAASVPCGFTSDGLPVGLQIVGPSFGDALVLRAARAYESCHPFRMPSEPMRRDG